MGVPKFFRWLSERYPRIIQRHGSRVETTEAKPPKSSPDPLSECGLAPPVDRLYIDMNGIIHGASHNNAEEDESSPLDNETIFQNVCFYLERIVNMAAPNELVYMAIDGVAPRAKLNQQRSRRYRSGQEGAIAKTVYEAHMETIKSEEPEEEEDEYFATDHMPSEETHSSPLTEVEPGRFTGKFESQESIADVDKFHSNLITPGTEFFADCTAHLERFLQHKLETDWKHLTIIFSGPNTPGEGEHKIMQFIREQRRSDGYDPNLRHCIVGQDGDLIMLGLATHEPNLTLLREKVIFKRSNRSATITDYLHNPNFEFLHMNLLRDYLALEFETNNIFENSKFDLERTIDDFVFMTFLVGNDFLPHMPALDIADEAFDLLFYTYRDLRQKWVKKDKKNPYLTHAGEIVSGARLEEFLSTVGVYESSYYDYKSKTDDLSARRKLEKKWGQSTTPTDEVYESKEEADRAKYREMLANAESEIDGEFKPVLSAPLREVSDADGGEDEESNMVSRLGRLLDISMSAEGAYDRDVKGRYYADKFGFSPFDQEKHLAVRKAYVEGLVWNLKYYYEGCVSWEWFYPYHYGPMLSDLVDLDRLLGEISFKELGSPLKPFEQLLACLPPSHSYIVPEPYRPLMNSQDSPISHFYPPSFTIDMNGKRWPWEAVVLLPFIDSTSLLEATSTISPDALTEDEKKRNKALDAIVMSSGPDGTYNAVPFKDSAWVYEMAETPVLLPNVLEGTEVPSAGFPSLRDGSIKSMWRRPIRINVHSTGGSRYSTTYLVMRNEAPEILPVSMLAQQYIDSTIYLNYPCLIEGYVTAVSDAKVVYRGYQKPRRWSDREAANRKDSVKKILKRYMKGEGVPGTGGLMLDDNTDTSEVTLWVRPFRKLVEMPDGTIAKRYADFEVEVPLLATTWKPIIPDRRLEDLPAALEKDPFRAVKQVFREPSALETENNGSLSLGVSGETSAMGRSIHSRGFSSLAPVASKMPKLGPQGRSFSTMARQHPRRPPVALPRGRSVFVLGMVAVAASFLSGSHASQFDLSPVPFRNPESFQIDPPRIPGLPLDDEDATPPLNFLHGTTTLSFRFADGIVCAVDSRASLGNLVGSKTVEKVLPVHSHLLGTMAGGAADCQFWIRKLRSQAMLQEMESGRRMSVARASRLLANALYENRGLGLSVGTMMAGYDEDEGPRLYFVDNSGLRLEGDCFAVGSGSTYAQGILDTEYKPDLPRDKAVALGIKAIRHATFRDAYSGGYLNVYVVTKNGWEKVLTEDVASWSGN